MKEIVLDELLPELLEDGVVVDVLAGSHGVGWREDGLVGGDGEEQRE